MCLILFAYDCHPNYRLVVAANRDEYYNRPTQSAAFWPDCPNILAGKDLKQGGTWMGITFTGRFAALTNYREPGQPNPEAPSRGRLVQNYLESACSAEALSAELRSGGEKYNGFNLLFGTVKRLCYYSNREKAVRKVAKGFHGLSNNLLDVPWPKVSKGVRGLAECLRKQVADKDQVFAVLADQTRPPDNELPKTGVSLEWERILSPIYIQSPDYGTRSSTVMLVGRNKHVQFWERSLESGEPRVVNEVFYEFDFQDS